MSFTFKSGLALTPILATLLFSVGCTPDKPSLPSQKVESVTPALSLTGTPKKRSAATSEPGVTVDADGVVHIAADTLIAKHPRVRELCTIAEQCANVHVTAELVDNPKADPVIRGYTIVHIQSGLAPTGNNANSDAEYEAEAKADPAGGKLAPHEGGAKYKPNGDGTYTVVNELNGVYDSNPPHTALVRARTLQEARHLTIEAAIADYINDACSGTFPDDRVHCTKATAATQSQAASPKPMQARGAAPSDGTCTPAPEWPHMNRCPVSEQVFVDAYVRVNAGRDGLDLAQLQQLGRDEYTMSTGLTGAPTMLLGQYMPTSRGQRAMAYLVYGPYGQRLMRRPAPAPQTTAPQ
jgi:hypothetical protein